ncbi:MAG: endonuclease, partial [Prevotella sp.]|nr:endonuclease [Prevotella sp.]
MNRLLRITLITFLTTAGLSAFAINRTQLVSYAQSLKGKKKAELKTAIYNLTGKANTLSYGSGSNSTWWGFYVTDMDAEGYVIDRYSNIKVKFGNRGSEASGMNIEHSFPKSWWGKEKNQAYEDLYNLMPSNSQANSSKSNFGMGIVTSVSYDNGCIKVGKGSDGTQLWQPAEVWKGDFSRGYMYMATAYQNLTYEGEGLKSLQNGTYPTLKEWAYTLYLKWMREDKVSQVEVDRNNAVADIQGNRNLYVDFPTLAEYVWGDSIDVAFNPDVALTTADGDERYATYNPAEGGGGGDDGGDEGGDGGEDTPVPPADGILLDAPFDDITEGNNTSNSGSGTLWDGNSQFPNAGEAYQAGGAVKLGTSKKTGYIASSALSTKGGTLYV